MTFRLNENTKKILEEYLNINFPKNDDFQFEFKDNFFEISSAVPISESNLTYDHIKDLESILNADHKRIIEINNLRCSFFQFKNLNNLKLSKDLENKLKNYIFKDCLNIKDFDYYLNDYSLFLSYLTSISEVKLNENNIKFIEDLLNVKFSTVLSTNGKICLKFDFKF